MVKIKLFGTVRMKCGMKEMEAYTDSVKDACRIVSLATGFPEKEFKNCTVVINGRRGKYSSSLKDGDELVFMSPSGGG